MISWRHVTQGVLRCIVCGGEHQPTGAFSCDADGMDREIDRIGARRWNQITAQVMRAREWLKANGGEK